MDLKVGFNMILHMGIRLIPDVAFSATTDVGFEHDDGCVFQYDFKFGLRRAPNVAHKPPWTQWAHGPNRPVSPMRPMGPWAHLAQRA